MTRVWITGVGAVTPLGHEFAVFADNLLAGRSGVAARTISGDGQGPPQFVASVGDIPVPPSFQPGRFQARDRLEQLALSCAARALADAGLFEVRGSRRIGLVLGLGAEHLRLWEMDFLAGGTRVFDPRLDTPSLVHRIRRDLGLSGPATAVAAACASGAFALALARRWVREGWAELCLAGSGDLVTPMAYAGFRNLRALSRPGDSPAGPGGARGGRGAVGF
jgi:3-oxoacyl-[acyl-carrier-protein] synthase II